MSSIQLKLDKIWNRSDPPSKPDVFANVNEIKTSIGNTESKSSSFAMPAARWRPNQRPFVLPPPTINSNSTSSMRTIQLIDPMITPMPTTSTSSLKHFQSAQNLFSIGKRMPEVEVALTQLVANMEKCPRPEQELPQPLSLRNVTLHGYQRHAIAWMEWRESNPPFGGILADDMGLGKTVTTIAFLQLRMNSIKSESTEQVFDTSKIRAIPTTLVICPATLMSHWETEITKFSRMRCFIYHGSSRKKDIPTGGAIRAFGQYCVVLTSYELVRAEYTSSDECKNPLFAVKWQRVVLDEAHRIRSHKSQTSQACTAIDAIYRWGLTGTPIHNKADDFYSLLHFLHYSPFDVYSTWKLFSSNQYKSIERMKTIVRSLILRRTKTDYDLNGKLLVPLPSKQIEDIWLKLSDEEMKHYQHIRIEMTDAYKLFIRNRREKKKTNTVVLFTLMLKLRQACNHLSLVKDLSTDDVFDDKDDVALELSMFKLDISDTLNDKSIQSLAKDAELQYDIAFMSTKLDCLLKKIDMIVNQREEKCVVVSSWVGMLNIVRHHLKRNLIRSLTISGEIKISDRQAVVQAFNSDEKKYMVLLLSLKAGGEGLNLVGGNHLFLCELSYNPQNEQQACDRIYRIGQRKNVHIYRLMVKNTIEERISNLQERKLKLAGDVLAGCVDKFSLKLEDIAYLCS
ncbi:unnamed protein product [Rotaria socialis]|uniref:Uncharacterized protein n=1 Tax=Rotaria socialis TaxID=392032 RepID=A0A818JB77_9BILA|nr:unnamed protein product [Rotaria socialis]